MNSGRERYHRSGASRGPIIAVLIVVMILLGAFGAKFTYHWLKAERAEQFAAQGEGFAQEGKWNEAAEKYRSALQLDPLGYRGLRDAARLATQLNRPEAADLWEQVGRTGKATAQDRQDYAEVLINRGRLNTAEPILQELLKNAPDTRTLSVAAQYSDKQGDVSKAVEFMRAAINRAPADDSLRFQLANL